jgi:ferrochelatase
MKKKVAVVLFNLGGPSDLKSVKQFLFNLFFDKAIINLPLPFRWIVAKLISSRREKTAKQIYSQIGGKSPILENTFLQSEALQTRLDKIGDYKVFTCMRYTSPRAKEVVKLIKECEPNEIILLPLYPQFSTTTTLSAIKEFKSYLTHELPIKVICCFSTENNFIIGHVNLIKKIIDTLGNRNFRILFSAHGLPEKIINKGDPYQYHVEKTSEEVIKSLQKENYTNIDFSVCYQSRVGPLKWIGPSTESEIIRACKDNKEIILVPISFVSEHSETLVELDIEYKELAKRNGCLGFHRIEALGTNYNFIDTLEQLVLNAEYNYVDKNPKTEIFSYLGKRFCPREFCNCPANVE